MASIIVDNGHSYLVDKDGTRQFFEEAINGASVYVDPDDLEFLILELQRHAVFLQDQLLRQRREERGQ